MARVATKLWRLNRPSAPAHERIRDRVKGYECFERWEDMPEQDAGGA
jgi:hypothetical protein